jgi:hypothetical protein
MTKPSVDRALVMEIVRTPRTSIVADHIGGLIAVVSAPTSRKNVSATSVKLKELIARHQTKKAYGIRELQVTAFSIR